MIVRALQFVAVVAVLLPLVAHADEDRFTLSLPIRCELGDTCWIPNYVDLKPGKGVLDYTCGDATYDAPPTGQHKGIDFAVRDMAVVRQGVPVLAAASGQVIGMRDGMQDVDFKEADEGSVQNKECGNAVRIKHPNGFITQYCHMRRGSVSVNKGDRVERGQPLGLVGLSGKAAFPHLHFQVEQDKKIIDPFVGLARKKDCGAGESPLWDEMAMAKLPYQPTAIYNAGFSSQAPERKSISAGLYKDRPLKQTAPAIVVWAEFFRVQSGDEVVINIVGPRGEKIHDQRLPITADKAYYLAYSGLRLKQPMWPPGTYHAEVTLIRNAQTFSVARQVEVR